MFTWLLGIIQTNEMSGKDKLSKTQYYEQEEIKDIFINIL